MPADLLHVPSLPAGHLLLHLLDEHLLRANLRLSRLAARYVYNRDRPIFYWLDHGFKFYNRAAEKVLLLLNSLARIL